MILAGIAYPNFARQKPGWKIGAGGTGCSVWYGTGALSYLGVMAQVFGWIGFVAAVPVALMIGFGLVMLLKQQAQLVAIVRPTIANIWFMS